MDRELIWIEDGRFWGWGCNKCGWVFNPEGLPTGSSLNEMIRKYEEQRDKEFKTHVCTEHPKRRQAKS